MMGEKGKTREELLAELNALKSKIDALEGEDGGGGADVEAASNVDSLRRNVVKAGWVAPVILAVNLPTAVFAGAGSPGSPTPAPTPRPTNGPGPAPGPT